MDTDDSAQLTSSVTESVTENVSIFNPATDAGAPDMPAVQEHAIAAARERIRENAPPETQEAAQVEAAEPSNTPGPVKGQTDEDGNTFDPAIHESPLRLNKSGYIAKKRGGAKKKQEPVYRSHAAPPETPSPAGQEQVSDVPDEVKIDATATLFTSLFIGTAQMVGGEEFAPEKGEEPFIKNALATYFRQAGVVDVPPSVGVGLAMGMYVAKRWNRPVFAAKRQGWISRAKFWLFERFNG